MKRTHIVAGIILNPAQTHVFITKRPSDKHKGGFWEFPGGKVEAGESVEVAMSRELFEEIGIEVTAQQSFQQLEFDYPEKSLKFDFQTITAFNHEPYGKEGQEGLWVAVESLSDYTFPEANVPVLEQVMKEFC
ncbi:MULTISPECIES: 8-oxo-dGTP diphosphatase MutT [Vibrio]|uniref:8-oxo-dGTP diphosphatase n=2 Tax=Vibrio TaxID=662 RepID=A0A7X4LH13_9VIBR|nr:MULTISPECIES: 8-oxo-dGTP diphosphatase MutT [Vibrio]MBF9001538.1 8-oxo-dGTP diphosphatase MutT [Vibrio nitrifigilis]MZI91788.1 8-oxo-dGTP diphosphatase MutT [Vibrio eleionomae]